MVTVLEVAAFRLVPLLQGDSPLAPAPVAEGLSAASKTISLLLSLLLILILIPLAFIVYKKFFQTLRTAPVPAKVTRKDPRKEASRLESKGDVLAAARMYEKSGDLSRAAILFEKGKDLAHAAEVYESVGDLKKAAELYLHTGGSVKAAGIHVKMGEYLEAAKIFRNKGDHLRAGQALEKYGSKAAAAREYRLSGQFERAAILLKEEGMHSEAAEAYSNLVKDQELDHSNVDQFYAYAGLLALAHEREKAAGIYHSILLLKGDYKKAPGNLRAIGYDEKGRPLKPEAETASTPQPGFETEARPVSEKGESTLSGKIDEGHSPEALSGEQFRKETSLRNMIASGYLDFRYSMRLWVQIMKALSEHHLESTFFGCITPESIHVDMQNNVNITKPEVNVEPYTAPEVIAGEVAGPYSDVYSMGAILFEMVTGSLEHLGARRPVDIKDDIPEWLDELIVKCIRKDRRDRYLNTEEISETLSKLKH